MIQGVQNTDVCALLEVCFKKLEASELKLLRTLNLYLPLDVLSIFLGKRFITEALSLKPQDPNR
jgi:hypothetical protein